MYGGTTREDPDYPGGTTREDPECPGILSIPDTVSVRWYVWGSGGSRVSRDT